MRLGRGSEGTSFPGGLAFVHGDYTLSITTHSVVTRKRTTDLSIVDIFLLSKCAEIHAYPNMIVKCVCEDGTKRIYDLSSSNATSSSFSSPSTSSTSTTSTPSTPLTLPVNELVNFIAAESFQGAKPGYQFQLGNSGLGYYLTSVSLPTAPQVTAMHEVLVSEDGIMLERNHVLSSTLSFPVDYTLALDLIIHGKKDEWSSIVRFTSTSQNEGTYGDRLLGLFLPPSSTKLCISTDTTTQNNHHHYTGALPVGKKLHIVITVKGKTKTVSVNGTEHLSISDLQERTHHTKNVTVYASGTHYVEASATIQNVHFSTAGTTSLLAESNTIMEPIVEGAKLRLERSLQFKMNRTQLPDVLVMAKLQEKLMTLEELQGEIAMSSKLQEETTEAIVECKKKLAAHQKKLLASVVLPRAVRVYKGEYIGLRCVDAAAQSSTSSFGQLGGTANVGGFFSAAEAEVSSSTKKNKKQELRLCCMMKVNESKNQNQPNQLLIECETGKMNVSGVVQVQRHDGDAMDETEPDTYVPTIGWSMEARSIASSTVLQPQWRVTWEGLLNVRNHPNQLTSNVLYQKNLGDIVTEYSRKGDWICISPTVPTKKNIRNQISKTAFDYYCEGKRKKYSKKYPNVSKSELISIMLKRFNAMPEGRLSKYTDMVKWNERNDVEEESNANSIHSGLSGLSGFSDSDTDSDDNYMETTETVEGTNSETKSETKSNGTAEPVQNTKLGFGKHSGKTYQQVETKERDYCLWALGQENAFGSLKAFIQYLKRSNKPNIIDQYVVTDQIGSKHNVRKEPRMNAAAVSSLRSGDVVNVTEMRSGWMKIGAEQWTLSKLDSAIYLKPGTFSLLFHNNYF